MDARERLRAYLEQRRELGEVEFVLDGMSVEDALNAIDKLRSKNPVRAQPAQRVQPARPPVARAAPEAPAAPVAPVASRPSPQLPATALPVDRAQGAQVRPSPSSKVAEHGTDAEESGSVQESGQESGPESRPGLVVGTSNSTLFEQNPFHDVRTLDSLAKLIEDCTRCELYTTAKHAVPGEGDPDADFMCVGEAPGANEDETGRPFVGQAGGLLTKILAAIHLTREQVFITNVLKHRPPGNRNPQPAEVLACSPYLVRQIQLVKPKVILALGTFAAQTLLETKTPIGKLRGAIHRYYGVPVVVTYHPAALLRNPAWKRPTWDDVKLARHILDSAKS